MIALEMRNLAGGEVLHASRRAPQIRRCLALSFIMVLPLLSWSTAILPLRLQRRGFG